MKHRFKNELKRNTGICILMMSEKNFIHVFICFQKKEVTAEYAQLLQDIEPSMYNLSAVAMLLKYLSKNKDEDLLAKLKVQLYEKS